MQNEQLPENNLIKTTSRFKNGMNYLVKGGLQHLFNRINQLAVKKGVDSMGIEKFVNQCALFAAGSGAITGAGGFATMLIGIPLDVVNLLTQQFRVTLAISYHNTGSYKLQFEDFVKVLAVSLKVDAGLTITKNIMEEIAEKLLINIGSKTAKRLVPVIGGIIGGSVNYLFIKRVAKTLLLNGQPAKQVPKQP